MKSAKEMYAGEIVILGNPKINPYDTCLLRDKYLDMYGPLEVESVTHIFGHDTGFITEIKPNALVTSNESITYPILNNLIFAEATRELKEELDRSRYSELSDAAQRKIVENVIDEVFENEDFQRIAGDIEETQLQEFKENIKSQFRIRLESEDIITIQDIIRMSEQPRMLFRIRR